MANTVIVTDDTSVYYRILQNIAIDIPNQLVGVEETLYVDNGYAYAVKVIEDFKQVNWQQKNFEKLAYATRFDMATRLLKRIQAIVIKLLELSCLLQLFIWFHVSESDYRIIFGIVRDGSLLVYS